MFRRPHWFIVLYTIVTLATDIVLMLNEAVPRQQVLIINMTLLFLLGVGSTQLLYSASDMVDHLRTKIEKLQTPEAYPGQESIDLEEQPDQAFMEAQREPKTGKERFDAALEDLARRTRERMSNATN